MSETLTINFNQPIPLFPLPNCVLLPHTTVPLHIFEPRYRQMTADVLDSSGLIAMALFEGESWIGEYSDAPPLRPIACVGYIARHFKLDDGRYNLLLQGLCRARILEEVESEPYRQGLLEPTEAIAMEIDLSEQRQGLEKLLADPLLNQLASVSGIHRWVNDELPTPALIDLTITAICQDSEARYDMLAESNVVTRSDWLANRLRQTRRTLSIANRFMPQEREDGTTLN